MSRIDPGAVVELPHRPAFSLPRLLSAIRFDEVCVLQGAPLLGACFSMGGFTFATLWTVVALVIGNVCLVAHVFLLNDWAGAEGDLRDPHRAARTFLAKRLGRTEVGTLAVGLLAVALLMFSLISATAFVLALAIAGLSALYSFPGINGKGIPVFNSVLHLSGGVLHFLLGYAAFAPLSWQAVAIGCYFGLVFAAGHLTHEARDHDGDLLNGIRTNAVAWGRKECVLASLALFTLAYGLLTALALCRIVPILLAFTALLFPLHLLGTVRALRSELTFEGLRRLQDCYRRIHVVIGLAMLATVPPW